MKHNKQLSCASINYVRHVELTTGCIPGGAGVAAGPSWCFFFYS